MFEFGRELKRLFGAEGLNTPRDGLTGGDSSLLELLDLELLKTEPSWTRAGATCRRVCTPTVLRPRVQPPSVWRCNGPCV